MRTKGGPQRGTDKSASLAGLKTKLDRDRGRSGTDLKPSQAGKAERRCGQCIERVCACNSNRAHSSGKRGLEAGGSILDHDAIGRLDTEATRCREVSLGI